MDDLINEFIAETREGLEALDSELVRFEHSPENPATLSGIFRLIHTIKGTCGFLGLTRLQSVAHAAENVLGGFRAGGLAVTPAAVTAILDAVDLIRGLTDALTVTGREPTGDDSALIGRLDAVFAVADRDEGPAEAAAALTSFVEAGEARSLIEQLGGDATLDAASEAASAAIQSDPHMGVLFVDTDRDRLQGAVRDSLSGLARKQAPGPAFVIAMERLAAGAPDSGAIRSAFDKVADALRALDVTEAAIEALRGLAVADPSPMVPADPAAATSGEAAEVGRGEPAPSPGPDKASPVAQAPARLVAAENPANTPAAAAPAAPGAPRTEGDAGGPAQTIRVSVDALEHLMTVVSELVLIRNQLIQTLRLEPESPFAAPLHRLNQVTSELQEGVMTTRMQPISGAWAKLPRLVRDLAQDLGKKIDLTMSGQETELDRQVLELIKDPLTHMIRNAADHGLESPADRRAVGKPECGRITLQARHEGGAILIEVADDGRGLSAERIRAKAVSCGLVSAAQAEQMSDADARQLIFQAGFSTAAEVTAVSGRGVGMDVVRTNIEKIGGAIELSSTEGAGTRFTIRIPLTLTIVSALIVECCGERFAMPQSCVVELVSASGASGWTIEYIDGSAVLRLRDRLLPLISLQELLGLEPLREPAAETCIVVARVGAFTFGVIVDRVFDTEEIVVKPVATVLRHLKLYSGATIMGDGSVILILDFKGISVEAGAGQGRAGILDDESAAIAATTYDRTALLVFRAAVGSLKAAPLASVARIEEIGPDQIERVNGHTVIQYRGKLMPIVGADAEPVRDWDGAERRPLLVFTRDDRAVGLLVEEIVDIVESASKPDLNASEPGSLGSLIIAGKATEMIDVDHYWSRALNEAAPPPTRRGSATTTGARRLLFVDQSPYTQLLLQPLLEQAGYDVVVAEDPNAALALYQAGERFQLIMADTSSRDGAGQLASASRSTGRPAFTPNWRRGGPYPFICWRKVRRTSPRRSQVACPRRTGFHWAGGAVTTRAIPSSKAPAPTLPALSISGSKSPPTACWSFACWRCAPRPTPAHSSMRKGSSPDFHVHNASGSPEP